MENNKSPEMNAFLNSFTRAAFGTSREECMEKGLCVTCGGKAFCFTDELSAKEYNISGMCQICQDATFVDPEEDDAERDRYNEEYDFEGEGFLAYYDDDPSPYDGTYSEE